jgi:hypothetical protein
VERRGKGAGRGGVGEEGGRGGAGGLLRREQWRCQQREGKRRVVEESGHGRLPRREQRWPGYHPMPGPSREGWGARAGGGATRWLRLHTGFGLMRRRTASPPGASGLVVRLASAQRPALSPRRWAAVLSTRRIARAEGARAGAEPQAQLQMLPRAPPQRLRPHRRLGCTIGVASHRGGTGLADPCRPAYLSSLLSAIRHHTSARLRAKWGACGAASASRDFPALCRLGSSDIRVPEDLRRGNVRYLPTRSTGRA